MSKDGPLTSYEGTGAKINRTNMIKREANLDISSALVYNVVNQTGIIARENIDKIEIR